VLLGSISSTFYSRLLWQYFWAKKLQSQNVTREKLCKALLYKIFLCKMLMKLAPKNLETANSFLGKQNLLFVIEEKNFLIKIGKKFK